MSLLKRVRIQRYRSEARGRTVEALQDTLKAYEKKMAKLQELQDWIAAASKELIGVPRPDERWATYSLVETARNKLIKEIEELETRQQAALTEHLQSTGPLTLEFEDGSRRVLSQRPQTAGGSADLLPRDLLAVWRVAAVFGGSVVLGEQPASLKFGDKSQIATVKLTAKARAPKKEALAGEGALFKEGLA